MWGSTITQEQLHTSIKRLRELNSIPEKPKENRLGPTTSSPHRLTVEREIEITCNLAFLSVISDNHLGVMAVCVEEDLNGNGVTVRLASNTGNLATVSSGFTVLAKLLQEAASRGQSRYRSCLVVP